MVLNNDQSSADQSSAGVRSSVRLGRRARSLSAGMLGVAFVLGSWCAAPANAQPVAANAPTQVAPAKSTTPNFAFLAKSWKSGDRVSVSARGMTPGTKVRIVFSSVRGNKVLSSKQWTATASKAGKAHLWVTWPKVPVQRDVIYRLTAVDAKGTSLDMRLINNLGTWIPGGFNLPVALSTGLVQTGQRVSLWTSSSAANKPVRFRVTAWRGDSPKLMTARSATANRNGVATLTINWPAIDKATVSYSLEAVDARGTVYVTWLNCRQGTCTTY